MDGNNDTSNVPIEFADIEAQEPIPVEPVEVDHETSFLLETQLQVQDAVATIREVEEIDPKIWQQLDSKARVEVLQEVEARMADIQGRPTVPVTSEELAPTIFGGFDGRIIRLNAAHLENDMPVEEFINTIVHEGRHAYQEYATNNPGFVADDNVVSSWMENRKNYLLAEDYGQEIYISQPLEADAWRFANQITNALIVAE